MKTGFIKLALLLVVFTASAHSANAQGITFTTDLEYGMKESDEVRQLQEYLAPQGYFNHVITGNFLEVTRSGVQAWQTAHCVPPTGYFGPLSRAAANGLTSCATTTTQLSDLHSVELDAFSFRGDVESIQYFIDGKPYGDPVTEKPWSINALLEKGEHKVSVEVTYENGRTVTRKAGEVTVGSDESAANDNSVRIRVKGGGGGGSNNNDAEPELEPEPEITVTITPSSGTVLGGQTFDFDADVENATDTDVTWSASGGSINSSGLFSAPGVTATTTYTITASSTEDSAFADTATIEVTPDLAFVGWWKLVEGTGTTALDSSGHDNHGTWSGTPSGDTGYYDTNATSTFAYSGSFDGGDDIVTIPNINIGDARTITFWAYIPSLSGTTELVSKSSAGQGVEVIINSGTIQFWVMGSSATYAEAAPEDINLNDWNYITATYDGPNSTTRVYINGQLSGNTGTAPNTIGEATNLYFGTWNSGGRQFVGKLNDIRMYTELLNDEEVEDLYLSF